MHISVWQQWSSNHSASFTVIGEFDSIDDARSAETELKQILYAIAEWRERPENLDDDGYPRYLESAPLTPPETELAQRYGVEWSQHAIDWIVSTRQADQAVGRLDNRVFVTSIIDTTWLGPQPFDEIVRKLGADVTVTGEAGEADIFVSISCVAPEAHAAGKLTAEIEEYLANPTWLPPPWKAYPSQIEMSLPGSPELVTVTDTELREAEAWYSRLQAAHYQATNEWMRSEAFQSLQREMDEAALTNDIPRLRAVQQKIYELEEQRPPSPYMWSQQSDDPAVRRRLSIALHAATMLAQTPTKVYRGKLQQSGLHIQMSEFQFAKIQFGLPALLDYLQQQECTDITYELRSEWHE